MQIGEACVNQLPIVNNLFPQIHNWTMVSIIAASPLTARISNTVGGNRRENQIKEYIKQWKTIRPYTNNSLITLL